MKITEFLKNKKGASGIGTLIVFIAMVLVAAVAASVLINTSGFLQQKASTTGKESTEQVASGVLISGITGKVVTSDVGLLAIYLAPNAGSSAIDLAQTKVMLDYNGKSVVLGYGGKEDMSTGDSNVFSNSTGATATKYQVNILQDYDDSAVDNAVINKGDAVAILINTTAAVGGDIPERTAISGKVQPEFGAPGVISFTTPASYTTTLVELQ
ncbi:flagellin FlaB [Methanococcus maripaludis]|uniref:Flagellin n=1 Tax=Methanococcus maripaludis TaxID=39152 RepID=A0A7J9NGB1_METMI|nr:flagellin [Methanococcus maripaludis]MBA2839551.1 flagellin FlaB [Methanococcus maripaludis]